MPSRPVLHVLARQKQRIALAQALLKNPAILIMDEATSMFAPEGERAFIRECHEVLRFRTVILVTHRPESLKPADRILPPIRQQPQGDRLRTPD